VNVPVYYTLGSLLFGFSMLVWEVADWYPGIKALQGKKKLQYLGDLLPFLLTWAIGALFTLSMGGIAGALGKGLLWGSQVIGDAVYVYGFGGPQMLAPQSGNLVLTPGGLFVAILAFVIFLVRRKKGATGSKWRGFASGGTLALSAGVARWAAVPLASAANLAGVWVTAVVS
jgi:hypothetical protein